MVVDSENEEQEMARERHSPIEGRILKSIVKKKMDYETEGRLKLQPEDVRINAEIKETRASIGNLQEDCQLLQKIISDMVAEQAQLQVQLHVGRRKKSLSYEVKITRPCPVHHTSVHHGSTIEVSS